MSPEETAAAVDGAVVAALALLAAAVLPFPRARRWAPLLGFLALALLATIGGHDLSLWPEVMPPSPLLRVLGLAVLAWILAPRLARIAGSARLAVLAGLVIGAVPATALLVSRARTAGEASRLALLATAASAVSPLGGPAQVLLFPHVPTFPLYTLVPALLAGAAVASRPPLEPTPPAPHPAARGPVLLWAPIAWAAVGLAQLGGAMWWLGRGIAWPGLEEPLLLLAAAAVGSLGDPWLVGLAVERGAALSIGLGPDRLHPLLLGLALAPGAPLLVAAAVKGWRVLLVGLPLAALQLAIAAAWAALLS